jgi:hypothetical protein
MKSAAQGSSCPSDPPATKISDRTGSPPRESSPDRRSTTRWFPSRTPSSSGTWSSRVLRQVEACGDGRVDGRVDAQDFAAGSACFVPRRSSRSSCSAFLLGQACPRSGGSAYKSRGGRSEDVSSIARATPVRRAKMRAARAALRVCARSLTPGWRSSTSCTDRPASPLTRSSCIRSSPSAASASNPHQDAVTSRRAWTETVGETGCCEPGLWVQR